MFGQTKANIIYYHQTLRRGLLEGIFQKRENNSIGKIYMQKEW